jgi:hypothetical protein
VLRWIGTPKSGGKRRAGQATAKLAREEKEAVEASRSSQPSRRAGNLAKLLALGKNPSPTKRSGRKMA